MQQQQQPQEQRPERSPEERLKRYVEAKHGSVESATDKRIVELLSKAHELSGTRSDPLAELHLHRLLSTKVLSIADLHNRVLVPVMKAMHDAPAGQLLEGRRASGGFTFFDVFFLHFHKHSELLHGGSGGHLALLTETLMSEYKQRLLLEENMALLERAAERAEGLQQYNDLLVKQGIANDRAFADFLLAGSEDGPQWIDREVMTDPLPPDPALMAQITDLNTKHRMLSTSAKLKQSQLQKEVWARDATLARLEQTLEDLEGQLEATVNELNALRGRKMKSVGLQTDTSLTADSGERDGMMDVNSMFRAMEGYEFAADGFDSSHTSPAASRRPTAEDQVLMVTREMFAHEQAPTGMVALVFTDIQSSTFLWNHSAVGMRQAIKEHNVIMRAAIKRFRGYEVKTEGDAFMVSFQDPLDACRWCVEMQVECLHYPWPADITGIDGTTDAVFDADGKLVFSGIRVRMGIHLGEAMAEEDPTTLRMDYFGPEVNYAARVSSKGRGGEVVLSGTAYEALQPYLEDDPKKYISVGATAFELGRFELKGYAGDVLLHHVFADELLTRRFHFKKDDPPPDKDPVVNQVPAPQGEVCVVFTTLSNTKTLWQASQGAMAAAIELHNHHLRTLLAEHKGYEVHVEGFNFFTCFEAPSDAVAWCMNVQQTLVELDWPDEILNVQDCGPIPLADGVGSLWRGLRVRMGMHIGWPLVIEDAMTGRSQYLGPVVSKGSRIIEHAYGGELVLSHAAAQALEDMPVDELCPGGVTLRRLQWLQVTGWDKEVLWSAMPKTMEARAKGMARGDIVECSPHELEELTDNQRIALEEMELALQAADDAAPKGEQTMVYVCADVSAALNVGAAAAFEAVNILQALYATLLEQHGGGFVVRRDADLLVVSYSKRIDAVAFASDLHLAATFKAHWPRRLPEIAGVTETVVDTDDNPLFTGLRLQTALLTGTPVIRKDPKTYQPVFSGDAYDAGFRLLQKTKPGQITMPMDDVGLNERAVAPIDVVSLGDVSLGPRTLEVAQILPEALLGRHRHLARLRLHDETFGRFGGLGCPKTARPVGAVSFVYLDVENSPALWAAHPSEMREASALAARAMAQVARRTHAYHAVSEGDAALFVFNRALQAVTFCLLLQLELMAVEEWPRVILESELCPEATYNQAALFRGPRFRMSADSCVCLQDAGVDGREMYRGLALPTALRTLSGAKGGQFLCPKHFFDQVVEALDHDDALAYSLSYMVLEGRSYVSAFPKKLEMRDAEMPQEHVPQTLTNTTLDLMLRHGRPTDAHAKALAEAEQKREQAHELRCASDVGMVCAELADGFTAWEKDAAASRAATATFVRLVAEAADQHGGRVVRQAADATLVTFVSPGDALPFAAHLQTEAIKQSWPEGLGDLPRSGQAQPLWGGPRIRVGAALGRPMFERDARQDGAVYALGVEVEKAAEALGRAGGGGIVASEELWREHPGRGLPLQAAEDGCPPPSGSHVALTPPALKARTRQIAPCRGDGSRFLPFVWRPADVPMHDSLCAVVKVPPADAARQLRAVKNAKIGFVVEEEGCCLAVAFGSGVRLLRWVKEAVASAKACGVELKAKVGVQACGRLKPPSRTRKHHWLGSEKMKKAARLCEVALPGEVLVSSDVLKRLGQTDLDAEGFRSQTGIHNRVYIPGSVLEVKSGRRETDPLCFAWMDPNTKKKQTQRLRQVYLKTFEQRMSILSCTISIIGDVEAELMACYDDHHNGTDRSKYASQPMHQLSLHHRTASFLLDKPDGVQYMQAMKERAQRLSMSLPIPCPPPLPSLPHTQRSPTLRPRLARAVHAQGGGRGGRAREAARGDAVAAQPAGPELAASVAATARARREHRASAERRPAARARTGPRLPARVWHPLRAEGLRAAGVPRRGAGVV